MRIADVSAFYAPAGGGVRTYVQAKLQAAARMGHELIMIVPGAAHETVRYGPGAVMVSVPAPQLPVDRRYRYFDDETAIHRVLDAWRPDHVEASSPWSSAAMVGRWQGAATRSLVMHADPLAAYAYRWLGGFVPIARIDRLFHRFWSHLRGLGQMFDLVVCANQQLSDRLHLGGVENVETIRMGVADGSFSPNNRSAAVRREALARLRLGNDATLLIGVGRFSAEKRWDMVMRAVSQASRRHKVGMLLVGDGRQRPKIELRAALESSCVVLPRIDDRAELSTLLASSDALVHGCEAETFCLVAAEARASGIPLIVPDRGAAVDQLVSGAGKTYRAGSERSLAEAIGNFIERGPEFQRAIAVRSCKVGTMDDHFAALFARYTQLAGGSMSVAALQPAPRLPAISARPIAVGA